MLPSMIDEGLEAGVSFPLRDRHYDAEPGVPWYAGAAPAERRRRGAANLAPWPSEGEAASRVKPPRKTGG
jgi:hypothetical protein